MSRFEHQFASDKLTSCKSLTSTASDLEVEFEKWIFYITNLKFNMFKTNINNFKLDMRKSYLVNMERIQHNIQIILNRINVIEKKMSLV